MAVLIRSSMFLVLVGIAALLGGRDSSAEGPAAAEALTALSVTLEQALMKPGRPAGDLQYDDGRKPVEVIRFLGVQLGMTVLDVVAGAVYYTEILSAAVGPTGRVVSQNPKFILDLCVSVEQAPSGDRLPNVVRREISLEEVGMDNEVDVALLTLTLHGLNNMEGEKGVLRNLAALMKVLKPGGVLGVIDHVGIHGTSYKPLYLIDPAVAEDLIKTAGFEIEARSDLLANPEDAHTAIVFDPTVRDNTNRFLLRARKPAS